VPWVLNMRQAQPFVPLCPPMSSPCGPYITRKAIMVVFWAAWCSICRGEVPRINRLNDNSDVKVLAVNEGDSPDGSRSSSG
jgi:thiol-disulfide isomerase/thioredoxin